MTIIEYAEKLGLNLTDSQKGILNMWQESDFHNEIFILHVPRMQGRQLIYDLIQRYKGYQQGRADAIDECIKLIGGNIKSIVGTYNKDTPLTDRPSYRVAKNELIEELVRQLEQLKEQKE